MVLFESMIGTLEMGPRGDNAFLFSRLAQDLTSKNLGIHQKHAKHSAPGCCRNPGGVHLERTKEVRVLRDELLPVEALVDSPGLES